MFKHNRHHAKTNMLIHHPFCKKWSDLSFFVHSFTLLRNDQFFFSLYTCLQNSKCSDRVNWHLNLRKSERSK
ncbi:unnamed protein product [Brassica rapa]|uniref:Uncharacterized protein n=2 Tax=Brassica TaxID=3705 RepID=A0A3P5ZEB6_BRACM|nr:unnamed protein product [Brassica napus]CAG7875590.1 unnamed protein product [Brassica rapa]CDY29602.1 BnaA05g15680D [Brassica napus]VDC71190.1 unnamed protein product [Brassica rapa]